MSGALHQRTDHASELGWGVTGWDRGGQPRGMTDDGTLTRDPFLYHLEMRLRRREAGAVMLVRWAYLGWDSEELTISLLHPERHAQHDDVVIWETDALEALLERSIRQLWWDCQREPVRWSICKDCRRRECVCGQRSESQVNAEEALAP